MHIERSGVTNCGVPSSVTGGPRDWLNSAGVMSVQASGTLPVSAMLVGGAVVTSLGVPVGPGDGESPEQPPAAIRAARARRESLRIGGSDLVRSSPLILSRPGARGCTNTTGAVRLVP